MLEYYVNLSLTYLDPWDRHNFTHLDLSSSTSREDDAEMIEQTLLASANSFAAKLMELIQGMLEIPYNSYYAHIRRLRERIIYSKDGERELKGMYRKYAPIVWHDRFASIITKQVALKELKGIIDKFAENRSKSLFIIKF